MKVITPDFMKKFYNRLVTLFAKKQHTHTKSQITDFPTEMPASDVSSWAKSSTKPNYTKSEVGLGNVDNTADANKSVKYATSAGSASSASKATGVVDYGANNKTIEIGYGGPGISGNDIKHIAGYTTGNGSDVNGKIKDVSKNALKSWLGLGSLAYSSATIPTIVNNLTTTGTGYALDARQGKALNDSINNLSSRIGSTEQQGMIWTRVNPSRFGIGFWHEHCKVDFASNTECYLRSTYPIILYIVPNPKVIKSDYFRGLYYIIDGIRAIASKDISSTTVSTFRNIESGGGEIKILPSGKTGSSSAYAICVQPLTHYSANYPLYNFLFCYNYNKYSFTNCDQFNFQNNSFTATTRDNTYTNGNPNCLEAYVLHPANIKTVTFTD